MRSRHSGDAACHVGRPVARQQRAFSEYFPCVTRRTAERSKGHGWRGSRAPAPAPPAPLRAASLTPRSCIPTKCEFFATIFTDFSSEQRLQRNASLSQKSCFSRFDRPSHVLLLFLISAPERKHSRRCRSLSWPPSTHGPPTCPR